MIGFFWRTRKRVVSDDGRGRAVACRVNDTRMSRERGAGGQVA
jgi:hypothetical protein